MLPGVEVNLPQTDLKMGQGNSFVSVLTIGYDQALYFEGSVHNLRSIEYALRQLAERMEGVSPVLLVKAGADTKMEFFMHLCKLAKEAGFVKVMLAADEPLVPEVIPIDGLNVRTP